MHLLKTRWSPNQLRPWMSPAQNRWTFCGKKNPYSPTYYATAHCEIIIWSNSVEYVPVMKPNNVIVMKMTHINCEIYLWKWNIFVKTTKNIWCKCSIMIILEVYREMLLLCLPSVSRKQQMNCVIIQVIWSTQIAVD